MIALIVTIFYVLGIISAIHAIMTARTAPGAIAWSVSLVSFPFVAVPAYAVFGRSKFEGGVGAYEQSKEEIDGLITEIRQNLEPWNVSAEGPNPPYEAIRTLARMELTRGNRAQLLINGEATFDSILAGIAQAKDYALVQFYMFHDDGLGRQMQQALIERAKAGMRVYMLYDEVGSKGLRESYLDQLRNLGIKFYAFTPGFLHEKVMLVDDEVASVGTANFDNRSFRLNFEVTALIVDEAFATEMEAMFEQDFAHAVPIDRERLANPT